MGQPKTEIQIQIELLKCNTTKKQVKITGKIHDKAREIGGLSKIKKVEKTIIKLTNKRTLYFLPKFVIL